MKWKSVGTTTGAEGQRSYKFTYDKTGKLKDALSQRRGVSAWDKEVNALNESVSAYDHNGNIKSLQRNQRKHQLTGVIASYISEGMDNLTYTYNTSNANSLMKVTDGALTAGFDNGTTGTNTDYTYDGNGNLTSDLNKGITSITYNFLGKPAQITFSSGKVINYTYDATGSKLAMSVTQSNTTLTTDYANGFVYENGNLSFFGSPEGRVVKNGASLEYQYAIADHQGNTRIVFSSATPAPVISQTGFETSGVFERDGDNISSQPVMNHTSGGTKSQLLTGGYSAQVGVTASLKVYPGDKIKAEVYAKYRNLSSNQGNLADFASVLTTAFGVSMASTGELQNLYQGMNNFGGVAAAAARPNDDDFSPKAFITVLIFDKNRQFLDAAWDQLDESYSQGTDIVNNLPFDHLEREIVIKEEGYVYIFVSNENATRLDVHFDDFKITHTKTNVIQYNEYYPFGLQTSNSWTREGSTNSFLYNEGSELNGNSGWYETFFRGYDPVLGRFLQIDPLAVLDNAKSPYVYGGDNPILFNDPTGLLVNAAGLSDGQMRALYRANAWRGYASFGDWAEDNIDPFSTGFGGSGGGGRIIEGTHGQFFGMDANGRLGSAYLVTEGFYSYVSIDGGNTWTTTGWTETDRYIEIEAQQGSLNYVIGGADLSFDGISSTTTTIANAINGTAYNVTWGNVSSLASTIVSDIKSRYVKGQQVKIYGYSEGGNIALQVSRALDKLNIPISILFTVDAADGPVPIDRSIGANVSVNFNFFQTTPSPIWSRGDVNTGPGTIFNVNVTGPSVTHGNIDELMMWYVMGTLK